MAKPVLAGDWQKWNKQWRQCQRPACQSRLGRVVCWQHAQIEEITFIEEGQAMTDKSKDVPSFNCLPREELEALVSQLQAGYQVLLKQNLEKQITLYDPERDERRLATQAEVDELQVRNQLFGLMLSVSREVESKLQSKD